MQRISADERERIVAGAWTVLERSGFEGFKVQLVLREARTSARAFYHHFASKEALLLTLLEDEMRRSGVLLRAAVASATEPDAQVAAWIGFVLRIVERPKLAARARLFTGQQAVNRQFPDQVAISTRHLVDPLQEAIARGRDLGTFPGADPARDARMIYALVGGVQTHALDAPGAEPLDDVIAATVGFVLRALEARPRI